MDNRLQQLGKYNFWKGDFPELGLIRKEYLNKLTSALGNRLIKVLVG